MKDLKHYFTSPVGSDNESVSNKNGIISKKRRSKSLPDNLELNPEIHVTTKKRKKKKCNLNESDQEKCEASSYKPEKKRKKIDEGVSLKKPRISKLCENVNLPKSKEDHKDNNLSNQLRKTDSSKENSLNSSYEGEEKPLDTSNSLRNYFSTVDKFSDVIVKPNVLKVEAVVHYPPSSNSVRPKRLKTRLRRRKSIDLRPEYDIITSEEENTSLQNSNDELCLNFSVSSDEKNHSEEKLSSPQSVKDDYIFTNPTSPKKVEYGKCSPSLPSMYTSSKVKHDGTLNSFFKIPSKTAGPLIVEIDEEKKLARQQFLNSGVPERMRKQLKKEEILYLEPEPFPKQRHITQADILSVIWNLKVVELALKNPKPCLINFPSWSSITKPQLSNLETNYHQNGSNPLPSLQEKNILKKLKKEITDYPIGKWFTELLQMKNLNSFEMWNEKYKPKTSVHLIGNSKNVEKLKDWLHMLNNHRNNAKKGNLSYCSEDEFLKSEDESEIDLKNTAFLQGPSGCGKTATVYALAEEIGYEILEINSTCNRLGKKILLEFSEALQSHKVETNVLNFLSSKKNKAEEIKKSLILIKDVDVIFPDYDEGFISTIATLAATSKRPIILTLNEFQPKYLAKIIPFMHFKLDYGPFPQDMLCSWIRTVAAVEGISLNEQDAFELVSWSNGDIRKLLLQLQFSFANSSKVICTDYRLETVWHRMSEQRLDILEETKTTANFCNLITVCDMLKAVLNNQTSNDSAFLPPWHSTPKDSSELNQPLDTVDYAERDMIADTLQILRTKFSLPFKQRQNSYQNDSVILKIERDVISPISVLSHSSVASDYMPALRSIARSERRRLEAHSKRNNRYFNYLRSIGITENTIKINTLLSAALNSTF